MKGRLKVELTPEMQAVLSAVLEQGEASEDEIRLQGQHMSEQVNWRHNDARQNLTMALLRLPADQRAAIMGKAVPHA